MKLILIMSILFLGCKSDNPIDQPARVEPQPIIVSVSAVGQWQYTIDYGEWETTDGNQLLSFDADSICFSFRPVALCSDFTDTIVAMIDSSRETFEPTVHCNTVYVRNLWRNGITICGARP